MKKSTGIIVFLLLFVFAKAQNKYWVSFTDKANVTFDPFNYFDERTIQQRLAQNIPLFDSLDFPANDSYLKAVRSIVDSCSWPSRWLNGIAVYGGPEEIERVASLAFVKDVTTMNSSAICTFDKAENLLERLDKNSLALLKYQTERLQGSAFIKQGIDGKGLRIAVFDVGFRNADKHPAFSHLRKEKRIIATYDFVKRNQNVYKGHWHGTATLSCIAGKIDSINIGLATGAEILLARTENLLTEQYSEEENWLAAAEWADKQGVNIISSSLGYTFTRYFNTQMDGKTSLVARAASIAAAKGILVVNSAGNEGTNNWQFLVTPADVDSVLTVGGSEPEKDCHINFSSYGPNSVGKLKPNVIASGRVVAAISNKLAVVSGTSFSAPMVAGFAACAWQTNRRLSNMQLFDAIEKSSHLYPYYDYAHGFGIPQAGWFLASNKERVVEPTFDFVIINHDIKVILREEYSYPETESALGYKARRNFYYKIENANGTIIKYFVLLAESKEMLHLISDDFQQGEILTVHFEGYTKSLDVQEFK